MTRDEDWHRLIEGDDPNDPLRSMKRATDDAQLVFDALVSMDSAQAAHAAIAQIDASTAKRALMAAVVGRRGGAQTPQERREWMRRDAAISDIMGMLDFRSDPAG
jgi:hypothetical protein